MAVHNNLNLLFLLLFSLLLPCHLAQPNPSPAPSPGPNPPPEVTRAPSPSPGPSSDSSIDDETDSQQQEILILPSLSMDPSPGPALDSYVDDDVDTQQHDYTISPSQSMDLMIADAPSVSDVFIEFDLSPSPAPSADPDPQLKRICDSTDHPFICLLMVSPYLDGEAEIQSVLDVAIQASAQFTRYGQSTAQKLAGDPDNTPQLTAVLNECSYSFEKAVENYGKASEAIPEQDKNTLNTTLSAVVSFVAACRDANSEDSELYSISDRLIKMTTNCIALSSLMD